MKIGRWAKFGLFVSGLWLLGAGAYGLYMAHEDASNISDLAARLCRLQNSAADTPSLENSERDNPFRDELHCREKGDASYFKNLFRSGAVNLGVVVGSAVVVWLLVFVGVRSSVRFLRTLALWCCGLAAGALIGAMIGYEPGSDGGRLVMGAIAGPLVFICIRLWRSESPPVNGTGESRSLSRES